MKIQPDIISAQSIQGYGPGWVQVAGEKITHSVIIVSGGEQFNWHCDQFEDLQAAHFERLAQLQTELVLFGSGARLRFVSADLTRALVEQQIGLETMDTPAACRTYNILAGEGRRVAVALLMQ